MNHVTIIAIGKIIITKDLVIVVPKYMLPQPILTKITYNFTARFNN